jgi:hypothetical protein
MPQRSEPRERRTARAGSREAELMALRAENARLRRLLAARHMTDPLEAGPGPQDRATHVRAMLRDRASRNP